MRTFVIFSILAVLLVSVFAEEYILNEVEEQPSENVQRVRRQLGFGGVGIGVGVVGGGYGGYGGGLYPGYYPGYPAYGYGGYGYGRRFHRRGGYYLG